MGNSETSEVLISPNSLSTSDTSSMQVKDKAEKRKLEQTHTDDGASPRKERRLGRTTGLTRTQKRRRARKLKEQRLAEGAQELTVTASEKASGVAQEEPPWHQIATENQSSPTFADMLASRKAKRHRKKKKIGIASEIPNGDVSVQPLDTSVELEVVPGGKKKRKRRKKKLANGSVAESTGDSIPQRVRESGDVRQSATSEELQVSKESKPQVKAAKIKGKLAGESPQGETSPDQSVTLDVKGSAKRRKRKSESSVAETSPENSLTEDVKSPAKKRKEKESECSQVEMSLEISVTEDAEKKRRKRHKKKKAMVTGNNGTSEFLISPNSVSTSDKSLMEVNDNAEMIKLEQMDTDDGASPQKERRLGSTGLTRTQKRRRARKLKKQRLAEAAQEVAATASENASGVALEKPPQNQITKENQSSPTFADKLPTKKAKRHTKNKKIGIASEKPDGDGPVQPVDTSVDPEVVPGEKKKKKRRKKKLANGSVAESTGDSVPQRVWESRDVVQSAMSEESQVSKESKPQVKGKLAGKRVILKRSVASKRLNKLKNTLSQLPEVISQSDFLLQLTRRCFLCVQ